MLHFLIGFVFCFVDASGWLADTNPFAQVGGLGSARVAKLFNYSMFAYFFLLSLRSLPAQKSGVYRFLLVLSVAVAFYAGLLGLLHGQGPRSFVCLEVRHLLLAIAIVPACYLGSNRWTAWLRPFVLGALTALVVRAVLMFGLNVGAEVQIGDVTSRAYDGGYLHVNAMCCLGLVLAACFFHARGQSFPAVLCLAGALLLFAVMIFSFRRMALLRLSAMLCLAFALLHYLERKPLGGLIRLATLCLGICLIFGATYVAVFGRDVAMERLGSLLGGKSESRYAGSNRYYLEDWRALPQVVRQSSFLGVGFSVPYGVRRDTDDLLAQDAEIVEVPLHTGVFELYARLGLLGLMLHGALLACAVSLLVKARGRLSKLEALVAAGSASSLLLTLVIPFGPPFNLDIKTAVVLGLSLGSLVCVTRDGSALSMASVATLSSALASVTSSRQVPARSGQWTRGRQRISTRTASQASGSRGVRGALRPGRRPFRNLVS